jgi:hypothetical protein
MGAIPKIRLLIAMRWLCSGFSWEFSGALDTCYAAIAACCEALLSCYG